MKALLYYFLKGIVRAGLYCYFQEIRMEGIERIPREQPAMLLPNHQNALLDALLYAAYAPVGKPYFLTRSDVFSNPLLRWVFQGLHMIPVYRLRDGRDNLHRNQEIFDRCAALFARGEHLLLFPEANHNLRRQVRPLSKGFTRILEYGFQKYPGLEVQVVPVGLNYQCASAFPDRVAFCFGSPFSARDYWSQQEGHLDVPPLRDRVSAALRELTTHIPEDAGYDACLRRLQASGTDLTDPSATRRFLASAPLPETSETPRNASGSRAWRHLFRLLNAPVWLPWHRVVKDMVWEVEFMSTFRFLYSLFAFPLYYLLLGLGLAFFLPAGWAAATVGLLFAHNLAYVKLQGKKKGPSKGP